MTVDLRILLKPWFDRLASSKGLCCSFADGFSVQDIDWDTQDGEYRVRIEGQWLVVPDDAVVTEPNRFGPALVRPHKDNDGTTQIRCFMGLIILPDSLTIANADLITALASFHRVPAIYPFRIFATHGGLLSYGADFVDLYRNARPAHRHATARTDTVAAHRTLAEGLSTDHSAARCREHIVDQAGTGSGGPRHIPLELLAMTPPIVQQAPCAGAMSSKIPALFACHRRPTTS
jgi:hypothetical protein